VQPAARAPPRPHEAQHRCSLRTLDGAGVLGAFPFRLIHLELRGQLLQFVGGLMKGFDAHVDIAFTKFLKVRDNLFLYLLRLPLDGGAFGLDADHSRRQLIALGTIIGFIGATACAEGNEAEDAA
jgi:hypothetical protein